MPKIGAMYSFSLPGKDTKMVGELVKETPSRYHLRVEGQKTVKVVPKEVLKGKRPMSKTAREKGESFKGTKTKRSLKEFGKAGGSVKEYKMI